MITPEWIDRAYGWDSPLPWYKRAYIRLIIVPCEDFLVWWYWKVTNRWRDLQNAIMRVKCGHDWVDTWNINSWFSGNIIPMLENWLKNGPTGHPVIMITDEDEPYEMTYEKWVEILNEMLEGFKLYQTFEGEGDYPEIEPDIYDSGTMSTGKSIFDRNRTYKSCQVDGAHYMTFDGVWHKVSMTKEEENKVQRSLELFSKYFYAMWD